MFKLKILLTYALVSMNILCLASPAVAQNEVDNFALLDSEGRLHELHYYSYKKAIVIVAQGNGCPIVRKAISYLNELNQTYAADGILFLMINANPQDDRAAIKQEAGQFNIAIPILEDTTQYATQNLSLTRTGEAVVIDPATWRIVYRGAIHDGLDYETSKEPRRHYLREAIDSLLAGKPIESPKINARGCLINFENNDVKENLSYTKQIAPILIQKCLPCHTPGGLAPWSMDSYQKVNGFGPMIGEVIRTKRMPPWHADPHYGVFANDLSLNRKQTERLLKWVKDGLPRGKGKDPLLKAKTAPVKSLNPAGALVISLKEEQTIAPNGTDDYRFLDGDQETNEDIWVKAFHFIPGNAKSVHHCNLVVRKKDPGTNAQKKDEEGFTSSGMNLENGQMIAGYSPGSGAFTLPDDTGIFIPKGSVFSFRMHYIPTGRQEKDRTKILLSLHKIKPRKILSAAIVKNNKLKIPPGERDYQLTAEYDFKKPATLIALQPHMHYRGRSMRFTLAYPDGRHEIALSVPDYKFHWQRWYLFKNSKDIPAGTKLIAEAHYDNSEQNSVNPNPLKTVDYGPGSEQEMFTGIIYLIYKS